MRLKASTKTVLDAVVLPTKEAAAGRQVLHALEELSTKQCQI